MENLEDIKVKVNPETSKLVQEYLQSIDIKWYGSSKKIKNLNAPYLFIYDKYYTYSHGNIGFFNNHSCKEVSVEFILNGGTNKKGWIW